MNPDTQPPAVTQLVDHLFRRQSGRILARLTRIFGPGNLDLAEEVVQEALMSALQSWPFHGVPDKPEAWIVRVARNRALDVLRRESRLREKQSQIELQLGRLSSPEQSDRIVFEKEIAEDQLRMIFMCCHPSLPPAAAVALTLKTVGGFGVSEIARALLARESAVAQRLVRAKRQIRRQKIGLAMPRGEELARRLDSVLAVLYLMFNEGYSTASGERVIRGDLCREAIRLTGLLVRHPLTKRPRVEALLALMLFQAARLPARQNGSGELLLLSEQDRSLWDRNLIQEGFRHLESSIGGGDESQYHLEAAIAATHASAPSYQETDWRRILGLYDALLSSQDSPVVRLNRSVALCFVRGPAEALSELDRIRDHPSLRSYSLLPATMAAFQEQLGKRTEAARLYRQALRSPCSEPEKRFLERKLTALEN